jgi:hypothetical protein
MRYSGAVPSRSQLLAVLAEWDREDGELSSAHLTRNGLDILPALASLVEANQRQPEITRLFSVLLGEGLSRSHPAHGHFVDRYKKNPVQDLPQAPARRG